MRTSEGAIGKDIRKDMKLTEKRSIRFRLADYKKNLLEEYNKAVILLNGDLERLISEGKEKEFANKLVAGMQALFNDVKFIFFAVNPDFVTDELDSDPFENALDKAVREHVEGVRNEG